MRLDVIKFHCSCGTVLRVPANAQGKLARCPSCRSLHRIPIDSTDLVDLDRIMDLTDQIRPRRSSSQSSSSASSSTVRNRCRHCDELTNSDQSVCSHCGLPMDTSAALTGEIASKFEQEDRANRQSRSAQPGDSFWRKTLRFLLRSHHS